ncbi:MAG TPA: TM0106 family RecB-like putative nuclease [Syntrophales bacterium]|nr:TM0106 family RecB-like putative nuclease [Syntrophales bacterium]
MAEGSVDTVKITASLLYNYVRCPHRVAMDLFEDPERRDPVNPFVQLLWDRGHSFEKEVVEQLDLPYTDLKEYRGFEKERLTLEAMSRGDGLIYGGRIAADDLAGEPDILRNDGNGYAAGDIKSGAGLEGANEDSDGKPKLHYAVQLSLYTDILERNGLSAGRNPFVWDVHGEEVAYSLDDPQGPRKKTTLWEEYGRALDRVRDIAARRAHTLPAHSSGCSLCHWRTACRRRLEGMDDLSLIPDLGRTARDALLARVKCREDLAAADLGAFLSGDKTCFRGIGPDTLRKFQERARLQLATGARPYLKGPVSFPQAECELFFDVETDPMRDVCYLHGFLERRGENERYVYFFAGEPTAEEEKRAFAHALGFIRGSAPCVVYYYSAYERTVWKRLQEKYPDVTDEEEIFALFNPDRAVDLYHHVVRPKTEWPTCDHSIKTLASHLGFAWRDPNPSGAASIEWYHRWTQSREPSVRQRIFEYNEDDCIAMRVLLEGIKNMEREKI